MHPVVRIRTYVVVWAILTVMTVVTWAIAEYVDIGPWNIVVALLIAIFKMSLVVIFFMNVRAESPLTKLFVGAGFFWLIILIVMTLGDYQSRGWLPEGKFW